jgi:3-oxoacyl-[acyl-carrier protein] reductase
MTENQFDGAVALVTGAGSGIGAATTRSLAERGARAVVMCDIDEDTVTAEAATVAVGHPIRLDVGESARVAETFASAVAEFGRIDVVVHAAGVDDPDSKKLIVDAVERGEPVDVLSRLTDEGWRRVMRINLDGTFFVLREAAAVMKVSGSGAIVTVGSSSALDTLTGYPHYAASKAGVHALSQAAAKSWRRSVFE